MSFVQKTGWAFSAFVKDLLDDRRKSRNCSRVFTTCWLEKKESCIYVRLNVHLENMPCLCVGLCTEQFCLRNVTFSHKIFAPFDTNLRRNECVKLKNFLTQVEDSVAKQFKKTTAALSDWRLSLEKHL